MQVRRTRSGTITAGIAAAALAVGLGVVAPGPVAQAEPAERPTIDSQGILHLPHDATFRLAPELASALGVSTISEDELPALASKLAAKNQRDSLLPAPTPEIGAKRMWPALDATGMSGDPVIGIYLKEYELKAAGDKMEVWVASGPSDGISEAAKFPEGDCRNPVPGSAEVTTEQAQSLVKEFDNKIYPIQTKVFSTPPDRDGTTGIGGGLLSPLGVDYRGDGDTTVTLVDNVRDPNFYDFENNRSYIAGFFTPVFNQLTDRNVQTIDAFDWKHRTGANPPDEPNDDLCKSRPSRPKMYEGVFSHEWQHLLMSYTDPTESTWLNEGLSDIAAQLTGYSDPSKTIDQTGADAHIFCYQGYGNIKAKANPNPRPCGGPQQSLTLWGDEGQGAEILADYGATYSFLVFLADRYGEKMITALHNDPDPSIVSVQKQLDEFAGGAELRDVIHDFQVMNLVDNVASTKGAKLKGAAPAAVTTETLKAELNLNAPVARTKAGVAPNGADYIRLGKGSALKSFVFSGAATLPENEEMGAFAAAPLDVENWNVQLVGIDTSGKNRVLVREFQKAFSLNLDAAALKAFSSYPQVVAVISHDDSRDMVVDYAPYSLKVNGTDKQDG